MVRLVNTRERPLRFGVICDRGGLVRWQADVVGRVGREEAIPVVRITLDSVQEPVTSGTSVPSWPLSWRLYRRGRLERLAHTQQRVETTDVLGGLPVVRCDARVHPGALLHVDAADVEEVTRYDLDFILAFLPQRLSGAMLRAAAHGVWSFRFGEVDTGADTAPCFVELRDRANVVQTRLVRMAARPADDAVLHRGWVRTVPHSYPLTVDRAHRATIDWVARVCREIRRTGAPAEFDRAGPPAMDSLAGADVAGFVARQAYRKVARALRAVVLHDQWGIGLVDAPIESFLQPDGLPAATWFLSPSSRHYVADPFGLPGRDGPVLLVEAFDYLRRRGHVTSITPPSHAEVDLRPVIPANGHMSYPYLFCWRGEIFCTPETCEQRNVTLWRAVDFPREWERVCTLIDDFPAADPTIIRHERRWYLFCTDDDLGTDSNLHIFHAEYLTGPWRPHVLNPVKTDARSARPAGTPFTVDGRLYRPAQDSSTGYGRAVVVNEITTLTPSAFDETVTIKVTPDPRGPFPEGLHTLSAVGGMTAIDGKRHTLVPQSLLGRVRVLLTRTRDGGKVPQVGRTADSWTVKRS